MYTIFVLHATISIYSSATCQCYSSSYKQYTYIEQNENTSLDMYNNTERKDVANFQTKFKNYKPYRT